MAENYNLIFGANASQSYTWSDVDYQKGWETVGDTPPLGEQFDALQRRADNKAKDLNDRLTPIETNNTNTFRQPSTAYALKDIRFYSDLPAGWYLECSVAGTTDSGAITLPATIVENAEVTDGTVTWKIRKISSADGVPIATILAYSSNGNLPSGYLLCDGSAVSRTMYPDLFAAIGTTYGSGDGSTTFNLPDYNTAARFAQGGTVAGVEKDAGLPNITGDFIAGQSTHGNIRGATGAFATTITGSYLAGTSQSGVTAGHTATFRASRSNPIYGNSDTVQPNALTTRYIIKAFDGQTADSALIDITQYAQELAGKANITGSNLVHHRDVITTSGTYTAPVTGLYKITVKGGGGGGQGGTRNTSYYSHTGGAGGGEGGTTIAFVKMIAGDSASVVIGAGGAGGVGAISPNASGSGSDGGASSVDINNQIYTASGGAGGHGTLGGAGGTGTVVGEAGQSFTGNFYYVSNNEVQFHVCGGKGGGYGGRSWYSSPSNNAIANTGCGGGGGGVYSSTVYTGGSGSNGYVLFEYYTPGA